MKVLAQSTALCEPPTRRELLTCLAKPKAPPVLNRGTNGQVGSRSGCGLARGGPASFGPRAWPRGGPSPARPRASHTATGARTALQLWSGGEGPRARGPGARADGMGCTRPTRGSMFQNVGEPHLHITSFPDLERNLGSHAIVVKRIHASILLCAHPCIRGLLGPPHGSAAWLTRTSAPPQSTARAIEGRFHIHAGFMGARQNGAGQSHAGACGVPWR